MSARRGPEEAASRVLAASLDRATYAGYVAGFEAARAAAAALARAAGDDALATRIDALAPLPDRNRTDRGRG